MKVIVCVSLVPDSTTKVKIAPDGKSLDKNGVQFILNPYDEFAIEEAVQFSEKQNAETIAVSVGTDSSKEAIKKAFQMGIQRGVLIKTPDDNNDSYSVAKNLSDFINNEKPDIVLLGKQSIDFDGSSLPSFISELTGIPSINVVVSMKVENNEVTAEKEIEGGKEVITTNLPVIIGAQKGINNPRYPNLKSIMAAKKKEVEIIDSLYNGNLTEITEMKLPPSKGAGKILTDGVNSVPELVKLLREEAKVI